MATKPAFQTHFTGQIKNLIDKIYGRSIVKDSMLERAISFYHNQKIVAAKLAQFEQRDDKEENKEYKTFLQQQRAGAVVRHCHLLSVCEDIILLSESEDFNECNRKSAQLLGTIQLLNPTEGNKIAENNEQSKPLYKAILCLRLLDRLCIDQKITDPYICQYLGNISADQYQNFSTVNPEAYELFVKQVKIPLIMAALLQDIGNYHPQAQLILLGKDGLGDHFRVLDIENRKKLLQIDYRETVKYLIDGIGQMDYIGNSKAERDIFYRLEKEKLIFIKKLLKTSINPKIGIGNLLKVPQIYTSIVLSTKDSYNYKLIPKVYQALNQNAERGSCSQVVVDALYKITGMFPQGYGITYIPVDEYGETLERYEYAIVNQLYPVDGKQAKCRMATRHLAFIGYGQNVLVKPDKNLYFPHTAKQLSTMSKERLNEILESLVSNYQERLKLDLIPRCWHSYEYFSAKTNQNLWNKP